MRRRGVEATWSAALIALSTASATALVAVAVGVYGPDEPYRHLEPRVVAAPSTTVTVPLPGLIGGATPAEADGTGTAARTGAAGAEAGTHQAPARSTSRGGGSTAGPTASGAATMTSSTSSQGPPAVPAESDAEPTAVPPSKPAPPDTGFTVGGSGPSLVGNAVEPCTTSRRGVEPGADAGTSGPDVVDAETPRAAGGEADPARVPARGTALVGGGTGGSRSGACAPDQMASDQTASDQTASDQTASDQTDGEQAASGQASAEQTASEQAAGGQTAPAHAEQGAAGQPETGPAGGAPPTGQPDGSGPQAGQQRGSAQEPSRTDAGSEDRQAAGDAATDASGEGEPTADQPCDGQTAADDSAAEPGGGTSPTSTPAPSTPATGLSVSGDLGDDGAEPSDTVPQVSGSEAASSTRAGSPGTTVPDARPAVTDLGVPHAADAARDDVRRDPPATHGAPAADTSSASSAAHPGDGGTLPTGTTRSPAADRAAA